MKYLLLGNGEIGEGLRIAGYDRVVMFNLCRHLDRVAAGAKIHVFVSNTGTPAARTVGFLLAHRGRRALEDATVVLARNPLFYRLKKLLLILARAPTWPDYELSDAVDELVGIWPIETIGFWASLRLERRMLRAGMKGAMMPSTGMIALDWVRSRMKPGDQVALAGFSWEGWEGHPWEVERREMGPLMRGPG